MKTLKVVKIGGNIIDNEEELYGFLDQFSKIVTPKILIHGGGKEATKLANKMGVEVKMTNGRRITNEATLDIATMVYAGKINKHIVAKLQRNNCNAIGFSGADGNTIVSEKRPVKDVDFGFVGDIVDVNPEVIKLLVNSNITPVFCALTHDKKGQLLNTNADTIASELAISLAKDFAVELYYCFEKKGVLQDANDDNSLIETINTLTYKDLIHNKVITDGMLPKLNNCFHAINNEVTKVCMGKIEMLFEINSKFTNIKK
ncbi:acetylglutamate kinase [Flavobacteriaceae bacterium S0862]|nr:acetylglutamate kinase [Flavobacteriaceae bacterium S0862]